MKGYKGFDGNLQCRDFQYEVGKTYKIEGEIKLCKNGFHFCKRPKDIIHFYSDLASCRYCEIEAGGEIIEGGSKCVCSEITIVREIPLQEFLELINKGVGNMGWSNQGDSNQGYYNQGDSNQGYYNQGDSNQGNKNQGDSNQGYYNQGYYNQGYYNQGNKNQGDSNQGDSNQGYYNQGNYNIGDRNCGVFNTHSGCFIFNKPTKLTISDISVLPGYSLLASYISRKNLPSAEDLAEIKKLPNFNEKIMRDLILGKEK